MDRPQPPHISEGPGSTKEQDLEELGEDDSNESSGGEDSDGWLRRARQSYYQSTSYVDSNYRKKWEDSLRAFNNQHSQDSKYSSPNYDKRSKIYRPKTRTVIRKNEAAAASAFFSNMDVVSVTALNQGNKAQQVSAEVMKELLEYRLDKSIPWFQTLIGALQDAQNQGVVCSHNYWDYDEGTKTDRPCVDLFPVENLRIDPAASWVDPVHTSPYLIHLIPMYVQDVKRRMKVADKRGKKWRQMSDAALHSATKSDGDSTRSAREENREDKYSDERSINDYEVVWVQRHIHYRDGIDWHFYTLSDLALLSDPEPLEDVVFHGERPYVIGCCIIETHRIFPSSVPELADGLQKEANEIANQRLDNIKFVLNKGWMVKRGKNVDVASLVRNVPGRVTMMDDPETDVKESNWPDVTQSSYVEQERIDQDLNELVGNFSPANLPNRKGAETVRGMSLMEKPANSLTEYLLRTFVETWVQPTLRQVVKLEQHYETDEVIVALAADKAKILQKYGIDKVTNELLNQELTLRVNVGMGATDPQTRLSKFIQATTVVSGLSQKPPPGMNMQEVYKEIYGLSGYQDGKRFFSEQEDPEKAQLKGMLQKATQAIQMKQVEQAGKEKISSQNNQTKVIVQELKHKHENRKMLAEAFLNHYLQPAVNPPPEKQNGAGG